MPSEREHELPLPEFIYLGIGDAGVEKRVHNHDDVDLALRRPPGGSFAAELSARFSYAGRSCDHVLTLDRDGAEALRDALDDVLGGDD